MRFFVFFLLPSIMLISADQCKNIRIFSGTANRPLALAVAKEIGCDLGHLQETLTPNPFTELENKPRTHFFSTGKPLSRRRDLTLVQHHDPRPRCLAHPVSFEAHKRQPNGALTHDSGVQKSWSTTCHRSGALLPLCQARPPHRTSIRRLGGRSGENGGSLRRYRSMSLQYSVCPVSILSDTVFIFLA